VLAFIPAIYPWTYVTDGMLEDMPVGDFYLLGDTTLPRSSKPSEFLLATDNYVPVSFYINGMFAGAMTPNKRIQRVKLSLFEPPTINYLTVSNEIDPPVRLEVVVTHMAKHIEAFGREIYEYAGRTNERYTNLLSSPWTSFIADYQLPFRDSLPNIRSLRIMAVKMAAKSLFGESGKTGGVIDLVSAFTSTTPIVDPITNPEEFQPDMFQVVSSADDTSGYDFHVWIPNICFNRATAFSKIVNNVSAFELFSSTENRVVLTPAGLEEYEQHLFDNQSPECSALSSFLSLGCMDPVTAAGLMHFLSQVSICAYANPFDGVVERPGVGTKFLDSGTTFDSTTSGPPFDSIYDIDLYTDWWIGTPLVKRFDSGKCLDGYPTTVILPENMSCCTDAPDTVLLTTMASENSVTSPDTPNNPLFGGDDPGLLSNPYFGMLV